MKFKKLFRFRNILGIIILFLLLYYMIPSWLGGYRWTEQSAIHSSIPFKKGKVVYEKSFGNKDALIWDTKGFYYAKTVERSFGFLYRVINNEGMGPKSPDGKMRITWSANRNRNGTYDALFAAKVLDENIVKVVVSNDAPHKQTDKTLSEVKKSSSLYIVMPVTKGYAVNFSYLRGYGNFAFRGINADGKIISVY